MTKGSHVFRMTIVENSIIHAQIVSTRQGMSYWGFVENGSGRFFSSLRCLLLLLKCMYMLLHILGYVLSYKEIVKWDDVDGSIILYKCIYDSKKRNV
jgi:hypothetical protein